MMVDCLGDPARAGQYPSEGIGTDDCEEGRKPC